MVRVFIPTSALDRISAELRSGACTAGPVHAASFDADDSCRRSGALPAGLVAAEKYQGFTLPVFYSSRMPLPVADGNPMYGLSGQAKIFGERRSLAGRIAMAANLVKSACLVNTKTAAEGWPPFLLFRGRALKLNDSSRLNTRLGARSKLTSAAVVAW